MNINFIAPQTPIQKQLAELWCDILEVELGIHDSFFERGGDSLKATIFFNRFQEQFGGIFYIVSLFEAPTIAEFETYLHRHYPEVAAKMLGQNASRIIPQNGDRVTLDKIARLQQSMLKRSPSRGLVTKPSTQNPKAIFILSAARSGSTLLRIILGGHPQLFAPPQLCLLQFNTLAERRAALGGEYSFWREGTIHAIKQIEDCSSEEAERLMQQWEDRKLTVREFYNWLQQQLKDKILVDKTTTYAFDRETLQCAETDFENPLYIHLLRHPYGAIHSFEEAKLDLTLHPFIPKLKEDNFASFTRRELAEILWFNSNQNIVDFLEDIPSHRHYHLRFEDLVTNPETTVRNLCQFLSLDFHTQMLQPYEDSKQRMTEGLHSASRMLGDLKFYSHHKINAEVASRWQEHYFVDFLGDITRELAAKLEYSETIADLGGREEGEI